MSEEVRREIWDLRRDEAEGLAKFPYEKPAFADWADVTIVNRMLRQGFLEADPTTSKRMPRVRCTERGMEAVDYFMNRGWLKKGKMC